VPREDARWWYMPVKNKQKLRRTRERRRANAKRRNTGARLPRNVHESM
jgi:hypothetical protein